MKLKYILPVLFLGIVSCDVDNTLPEIPEKPTDEIIVALNAGGLDFSKYVSVGASFTAGFTDNALFIAGQENSFPNTLSKKFAMANGGTFNQPLMADNIGGLLINGELDSRFLPRLYFNGKAPAILAKNSLTPKDGIALPTTEATKLLEGDFNNYGIPGAKSFHFVADNYGSLAALAQGKANPYFVRMNPGSNSVIKTVVSKQPTFFTLSEIGGNDVLGYALSGGSGTNQTGNSNPATYKSSDITDPNVFADVFNGMVNALTTDYGNGSAKGVVATVPYITSLAHFTTVSYNPLDPTANTDESKALATQIPTLNLVYGALNQIFTNPQINQPNRVIQFSDSETNPVVIKDENLVDLSQTITNILSNPSNTQFIGFVQSLNLPAEAAPIVAQLIGQQYGQARPATQNDLLVLPSASIIGTINEEARDNLVKVNSLVTEGLASQFSTEGVTLPLSDKWVLTPAEQEEIKVATDAYNKTIKEVAQAKNLALVDFEAILANAAKNGVTFDEYNMTTNLVTGGLISLDGVHLTGRGYALMANEMLKAIDAKYGSNFASATNGLAKAGDYPTNYSPLLR